MGKRKKSKPIMVKDKRTGEWRINRDATPTARRMADDVWSAAVKEDWNYRCAICGQCHTLNSHHIIPRQHYGSRYEMLNGICLCVNCHQYCPHYSPHVNGRGFDLWLEQHHQVNYEWTRELMKCGEHEDIETKTVFYFCDVLQSLREYVSEAEFVRIVGKRFSQYLEEHQ